MFEAYDNPYGVTRAEYHAIIRLMNKLFIEAIVETGYALRFPLALGALLVQRQKPKLRPIDLNHYMKTGEKVYHRNRHSHGYMARWKWDKNMRRARILNRAFYEYVPIRFAKNYLAKCIKEKNTIIKYMEHDNSIYVH